MRDFAVLAARKHRGWPWPEVTAGCSLMFGDDGWCSSCGVPKHPQTGPPVLQTRGLRSSRGVWQPNWQFDVFCMEREIGLHLLEDFDLELWEVGWPRGSGPALLQLEVPTVGPEWFDRDELSALTRSQHGGSGSECPDCGVWKWLPVRFREEPPPIQRGPWLDAVDVAASPEWFGDGANAFRKVVFRRELAERIVHLSPRDFELVDIDGRLTRDLG